MTNLAIILGSLNGAFIAAWITIGVRTTRQHAANNGGEGNGERDRSFEHGSVNK